ncbi:hypothetical protein D3C71_1724970 [compost metagenome]
MFFYICIPNITFNVSVMKSPVFLRCLTSVSTELLTMSIQQNFIRFTNNGTTSEGIYGTIFLNVYFWNDRFAEGCADL